MYKVIAIMGQAGAGKDTILRKVLESAANKRLSNNLNEIISYTTRPIRENEVDGINYHFITVDEFYQMVEQDKMLEATVFNEWCYGTGIDSLDEDKINIGVFNPTGVESLLKDKRIDLTVYYIVASDKNRLLRQLNREDNPNVDEIIRRFKTDRADFDDLNDIPHIVLENNVKKDLHKCVLNILGKIK